MNFLENIKILLFFRFFWLTRQLRKGQKDIFLINNHLCYLGVGCLKIFLKLKAMMQILLFICATGVQCSSEPKSPTNGRLKCASGTCQASCLNGYKFPTGDTAMTLSCMNGRWLVKNFEFNEVPACERNCFD